MGIKQTKGEEKTHKKKVVRFWTTLDIGFRQDVDWCRATYQEAPPPPFLPAIIPSWPHPRSSFLLHKPSSDTLPRRGAFQGFASGPERDESGDDGEDGPRHQEPPPVQLRGEVKRHHPHLEQGHQLHKQQECIFNDRKA